MAVQNEQRLAVLIDADNASKGNLKAIMDEVAKYGVPTIKHAYGDWAKLAGWKDVLLEIGAVPVQQYAYTTGKNATDAALIIEAMSQLSALGSMISKKRPDFDSRNYGYSQLSKMLRAIPRFEVGGAGAHVWVKDKEAK